MIVGLIHPGAMGAAIGVVLGGCGHEVLWASEGRSGATRDRARSFRDVGTVAALAGESEVLLSVCPPHAAVEVAASVEGFAGLYVDANAVSPATAREVASFHPRFVDGGIVGSPPRAPGDARLYLSGDEAPEVAALFDGSVVGTRVVVDASAMKMVYAAWTKGTAALLLAIRDVARANGIWDDLQSEWRESAPELPGRLAAAERSAAEKGWRWIAEMEEIADTFAAAGAPDGFHRAAAEVYRG